ncbi:DMT family transporter [Actinomadura flavalba]|uniref:DMT family transporter n=1 Tax=Actinomadura flavalba TaxID=1120938 RepID=UPI00036AE1C4|nr:DMT family transporter [Actinomadura flavalba]
MVTVLALGAALAYGAADFLGGAVSRRSTAVRTVLWCVPIGLAGLVAVSLLAGGRPASGPLGWGFAAGLAGGIGLIALYRALARGPMSVVAPVSALAAAVLPVGVGVLRGERLDGPVVAGVLLCLAAIGLVSMERDERRRDAASGLLENGPLLAAVSGLCFGVFYILLKEAGDSAGLWPIVGARVGNLAVVLVAAGVLLVRHGALPGPPVRGRATLALVVLSGLLDAGANALYFLAAQAGLLSLAAVLTSLYPAVTVLLARVVYAERLRAVQRLGLAVAIAGVALVTVG